MKKLILFLLLSSYTFTTFSQVVKKVRGRIILSDRSCAVVMDVTKSLSEWTEKSIHDKSKSCPINLRSPVQKNGMCTYDITDCVPEHVVKYQDVLPVKDGPNCFNLALVMKGILPALRFVSEDEVYFYLNPPICRELKNNEKRMPGDIGAIREFKINKAGTRVTVDEYHAFVYISEKIAYSKNGYEVSYIDKETGQKMAGAPYSLESLNSVLKGYGVENDKDCRGNEFKVTRNCTHATTYFRCISMEEYLAENRNLPPVILETASTLESFEQCLEVKMMSGTPIPEAAHKNITDSIEILATYLNEELEKNNLQPMKDENQIFLLASIRLKLSAIETQFDITKSLKSKQEFLNFSDILKKITDKYKAEIREKKKTNP